MQPSESEIARWARVRKLFEQAASMEGAARDLYLDSACSDEPSLREELKGLLAEHDRDRGPFQTVPDAVIPIESRVDARTVVAGRFEIVRPLGAGGMGQVYEAFDRELGERVALKMVRDHLVLDPKVRERFKHEILNGRRVTHPNVCRIYDLVHDDHPAPDRLAFTMELLAGETLAQLLKREGRLSVDRALPLARQMAAGLAALHERNIVHRDFKPANVMLIDDGGESTRVKITDFGLARRDFGSAGEGYTSLTGSYDLVGTPNYMAPEQLGGQREAIGPPTDVYALGLTLYETVAGVPPFSARTLAENVIEKSTERPRAPSEHVAGLPRVWDETILRCLEADPAHRPQASGEVVAALEGRATLPEAPPRSKAAPRRTARWAAVGAAAIFLALSPWFSRLPFSEGGRELRVAVLPFSVVDGDRGFADGLMDTISKRLAQFESGTKKLDVMAPSAVFGAQVAGAMDARTKFGVNYAIEGDLRTQGDRLRLTFSLVDAVNGGQLRSSFVDGSLSNVMGFEDDAVMKLATLLELRVQPAHVGSYRAVGNRAPGAYKFYVQALGYLQRSDQIESLDLAIRLFQRALEEDSASAAAHAGLAKAHWYKYERLNDVSDAEQAARSAQQALDLDPELLPAQLAMGRVLCGKGEYERALEYLNRAVERDPEDGEGYELQARALDRLGRINEAEAAFQTATMRRPWDWALHKQIGLFYLEHSRLDEAIESLRAVVELSPDNAQGYSNLGGALYQAGRLAESRSMFEKSLEFERRPSALANLGMLEFGAGNYARAAEYYHEAVESRNNNYTLWGNLGASYYWAGDPRYKEAYARAVELIQDSLAVNPRQAHLYGHLALYQASRAESAAARAALKRASEGIEHASAQDLVRIGHVHELLGERALAITFLKRGLEAGFSMDELERMPRFKDLLASEEWKSKSEGPNQ